MDGRAMALAGYSMKVWTLDSMLGSFAVTVIPVWYCCKSMLILNLMIVHHLQI